MATYASRNDCHCCCSGHSRHLHHFDALTQWRNGGKHQIMTETKRSGREGLRNLHVEVPEPFHRKVKMLCAMQGITLKDYAVTALEEKVARDEETIASDRQ